MVKAKNEMPSPENFIQSMRMWMINKNMQVGGILEEANARDITTLFRIAAGIFTALGSLAPMFVSGGAKAEKVQQVLEPYIHLSDLVGVNFSFGLSQDTQYIIPVVCADGISPQEINERFELFTEFAPSVANLGLKFNFQTGVMFVHPLIVYFDPQNYAKNARKVLANGWRRQLWKKVYLRACTINIAQETLKWAEPQGISKQADRAWEALGIRKVLYKFGTDDLHLVLSLAEKLKSA